MRQGWSPHLLSAATSSFIECELTRSDAVGVIMSNAVDIIRTDKAGSDVARGCWLWGILSIRSIGSSSLLLKLMDGGGWKPFYPQLIKTC